MRTANDMMRGNTHFHIMSAQTQTNSMGTIYMEINGQPCNNPQCSDAQFSDKDVLWTQEHFHFVQRLANAIDDSYTSGYDDGYAHALEVHDIEEVD